MRPGLLLIVALLAVSGHAVADADFVYESYEGVTLGRVFLSPAERDWLDARRHERPSAGVKGGARGDAAPAKDASRAAGYISGPDGRLRVWRQGDFVESDNAAQRDMAFPGDVVIEHHATEDVKGDED